MTRLVHAEDGLRGLPLAMPASLRKCIFNFAGCKTTFDEERHWKRHVETQHLLLDYWRCTAGACANHPNGAIFNRKDLFTQHLLRVHAPKHLKSLLHPPTDNKKRNNNTAKSTPQLTEWDTPLKTVAACWGEDVVRYYQWVYKGPKYCKVLCTAARSLYNWKRAVKALNWLMLERSQHGPSLKRRPIHDSSNPIQQGDLDNLAKYPPDAERVIEVPMPSSKRSLQVPHSVSRRGGKDKARKGREVLANG